MISAEYAVRRDLVDPQRLRSFFAPRSIAVVGASDTSSWARNLMHSLRLGGGTRDIVVHPRYRELFGRPTVPTLRDLPEPADLAFVMVGPNTVESILEDAAVAGIHNVVVLAAGYGEAGDDGVVRQKQLAARAVELDLTILGPNTIGFINAPAGVAPWAVASYEAPLAGPVAAVFESGSMARAGFEFAQAHGVGSSLWAAVGNAAVINTLDVMDYLIDDDNTRAIALFLETVREPNRFMQIARRAVEAGKPIVAFKAGRSEVGMRSAMAHTGAMATDDAVVDAAFRQAGVVRVESLEELIATAGLFGYSKRLPAGRRMGVVTSSGGGCNVIADLAEHQGIELPPWQPQTVARLREHLPPFASVYNPLDTTGFGHARARPRPTKAEDDLLEIAMDDPGVDFMYSMMTPLPSTRPDDPTFIESRLAIIGEFVARSPVPVFLSSNTCLDVSPYPRRLLADNGLFLLPGGHLAMAAIGHMVRWVAHRDRLAATGDTVSAPAPVRHRMPGTVGAWAEDEGRALLAAAGVPMVPATLAGSAEEAVDAAARIDGPVVLKVCSREIAHKSDIGGVRLDLRDPDAVRGAYGSILAAARTHAPDATVRGVLVSPMRPPGVELLVGVTVDPTFGPVLAVALGGVWVEILNDTSLRTLPVDRRQVRDMLAELRGARLLTGARGAAPVDLDALADVVVAISHAALSVGGALEALEVNPLRVSERGIEGLDVLVSTTRSAAHD